MASKSLPSSENAEEFDPSALDGELGPDSVVRQGTDWLGREARGHWSERDLAEGWAQ